MGGGGSSPYVPENVEWTPTQCITSFSECDPITHQITIRCDETNDLTFREELAVQSIVNIPSSIIPDGMPIVNVDVWTEFDHTAVVDVQAFLYHNDIATVLFGDDHEGNSGTGCAANNVNVVISDNSPNTAWIEGQNCDSGCGAGICGSHKPVDTLSTAYSGQPANGEWTFYVHDQDIEDSGLFGSWSITLTLPNTYCTPTPTTDPTNDPTKDPTSDPTADPTADPTSDPTSDPTIEPTNDPTADPTVDPTSDPTTDPTPAPTGRPTTKAPTIVVDADTASPTKGDGEVSAESTASTMSKDESDDDEDDEDEDDDSYSLIGMEMNGTAFYSILSSMGVFLFCCILVLCYAFFTMWRKKNELEKKVETYSDENGKAVDIERIQSLSAMGSVTVTGTGNNYGEHADDDNGITVINGETNHTSPGTMMNVEMIKSDTDGSDDSDDGNNELYTGITNNNNNNNINDGVNNIYHANQQTPMGNPQIDEHDKNSYIMQPPPIANMNNMNSDSLYLSGNANNISNNYIAAVPETPVGDDGDENNQENGGDDEYEYYYEDDENQQQQQEDGDNMDGMYIRPNSVTPQN